MATSYCHALGLLNEICCSLSLPQNRPHEDPVLFLLSARAAGSEHPCLHSFDISEKWSFTLFLTEKIMHTIITARNSSCGKVMFPQTSVSHSVHGRGGGGRNLWHQIPSGGRYLWSQVLSWGVGIQRGRYWGDRHPKGG